MKFFTRALMTCLCLVTANSVFAMPQDAAATKKTADAATTEKPKTEKKIETDDVKVKNLTLKVPKTWVKKRSASSMRLATYEVKPVDGEKDSAELTVFNFSNQGIKANIDRWIGQFSGTGRKSKLFKGTCDTGEYYLVNISGTFKKPKPGAGPFGEKIDAENYRMLGVVLPVKGEGMFFLKLAGPDKTVAAQLKGLRGSFGGKADEEKEAKLN